MRVENGYLYYIKDAFFDRINSNKLMINHENGHSRPSYLVLKDKEILWFIPLSTKVEKYIFKANILLKVSMLGFYLLFKMKSWIL